MIGSKVCATTILVADGFPGKWEEVVFSAYQRELEAALSCEGPVMDTYSSGEDLIIKARKPYTITKQRERWTEEEHNSFIEALKLYGRAWQRIEEHVGTKTAVQIRSHAQKFFSKLEKEALIKGIPLGQALDISIPPPRPKKKPSNPYPRKTSAGAPNSLPVGPKDGKLLSSTSLFAGKQILDLENEPPPEKPGGAEKSGSAKELDEDNCSEVLSLFQEAPCASASSASKNSIPAPVELKNPCSFGEFVPSIKETNDQGATNESYLTVGSKGSHKLDRTDANYTVPDNGTSESPNMENCCPNSHEKLVQEERTEGLTRLEKLGVLSTNEMMQATQNYPRHVPVHVLDGSIETCTQIPSQDMSNLAPIIHQVGGPHGNSNLFINPTASASTEHLNNMSRSTVHQSLPNFHPLFTPIHNNHDKYQSLLNISSTFSNFIEYTLLQNPAAHAAASLAASFCPCTNIETSIDSPASTNRGFPVRHVSPPPSMAEIAATTVAAATAWWAAHGLLLLCPPLHTGFTCAPAPTAATPLTYTGQATALSKDRKDKSSHVPPSEYQPLVPEFSEASNAQHPALKSSPPSSSDSEVSGVVSTERKDYDQKPVAVTELNESNKAKTKKQVDRSSCGSNTPSSSEVETDALGKSEKDKEESKEPDVCPPAGELNNRRSRSISNMNESWKEVSQGGRLAFEALFSREVLPQSFSPPRNMRNKEHQKSNSEEGKPWSGEKDDEKLLQLDLNSKTWTCLSHPGVEKDDSLGGDNNAGKGLLTMELGQGKLKARRTGFKPYKRCSVEVKECRVATGSSQGEEKGPKRIRLEGEAST
ncbi:hypothetical protein HHK36_029278 [Tetracentron sinense]|uniref:LHY n=1 Tax=Tetracentron sinense TaxID=13715 RepID=A0A834YEN8_TETSI|nr:hypothetical protein HHK36_029278 [Tetracentron sinense]